MANKIPVKAIYTGSNVTSLGEYISGDTISTSYTDAKVISVAGVEGVVSNTQLFDGLVATAQLNTSYVAEGSNLYYTDARARDSISVTGAATYDNTTGIINVTGGVTDVAGAVGSISNAQILAGLVNTGYLTTGNVAEVGNLYYTVDRANSAIDNRVTKTFVENLNINVPNTQITGEIVLGTQTLGDYVGNISQGTGVTITGTPAEGWAPTIAIGQDVATTSDVQFAKVNTTGQVRITDVTESVGSGSGALIVSGGASFGGNVFISGNLNVVGTTTTHESNTLIVQDPMIYLAEDNTSDVLDIGIVGSFTDTSYQHTGLVRDASDGVWKLFANVITEPTSTIDFTNATYSPILVGDLSASTGTFTGNVTTGNVSGTVGTFTNSRLGTVQSGTWQGTSISTTYTDAKIKSVANTAPIGLVDVSGDVTISLLASGVTANTYGGASDVPVITVDQYGRITAAGNVSVAGVSNFTSSGNSFTISTADGGSFTANIPDGVDLVSPDLLGTPTAPTASAGTNTTQIATTAFVRTEIGPAFDKANAAAVPNTDVEFANVNTTGKVFITDTTDSTSLGTGALIVSGGGSFQGNLYANIIHVEGIIGNAAVFTDVNVGNVLLGEWKATPISTTYTDAKVTSVAGQTGAISNSQLIAAVASAFDATGNLIPAVDNTYSIGSDIKKYLDLYLSGNIVANSGTFATTQVGIVTEGTWQGNAISTVYTEAKVVSVGGLDGAISNAQLASAVLSNTGNILPDIDDTYSIGSSSKKYKDLYLSGNTIHLGNLSLKDNGSTLEIYEGANLVFTATAVAGFTDSTLTAFPGSASNADYGEGETFVGDSVNVSDAFGVPLGTVFDCMEPKGRFDLVDLAVL